MRLIVPRTALTDGITVIITVRHILRIPRDGVPVCHHILKKNRLYRMWGMVIMTNMRAEFVSKSTEEIPMEAECIAENKKREKMDFQFKQRTLSRMNKHISWYCNNYYAVGYPKDFKRWGTINSSYADYGKGKENCTSDYYSLASNYYNRFAMTARESHVNQRESGGVGVQFGK